jgi:hypothetical protein
MGGTAVAVTTDRTAIFHNPAGLGLLKDKIDLSITPVIASVDGKLSTVFGAMSEHGDKLSDIAKIDDEFINELNGLDGYWIGVDYLPEATIAKRNLGFGMYSVFPFAVRLESGHLIPKLAFRGERDLVFTWAVGVPLKSESHQFGISIEYLQRTPVEETITNYTETFLFFDEIKKRPLGILGEFSDVQHGASFDVGFMHHLKGWRFGWDVKDIFGVVGGELVIPQLDFGVAYYFPQLEEVEWIRSLILSVELSDIVGIEEDTRRFKSMAKKVHMGAEWDLNYVALRAGINQGYPTVGLGVSVGVVRLDYVFFQEELGYFPGQQVRKRHLASARVALRLPEPRTPRADEGFGDAALPGTTGPVHP